MYLYSHLTLIADIGEVLGYLVGVVLFVIWLVGQITGGKQIMGEKQKAPGRAPPRQPARQPGRPQAPGRPPPAGRPQQAAPNPVADEIEEFLRRAAGRRQRGEVEEVEVLAPEPMKARGRPAEVAVVRPKVAVVRPQPQPARPMLAQPIAGLADTSADLGQGVVSHVSEHIGASSFAASTSRLGEDVALADDKLESRLHQKFDHSVSHLAQREAGPGETSRKGASPLAESLAKMFQSPESMRQVIILNEIFRRPEDRW